MFTETEIEKRTDKYFVRTKKIVDKFSPDCEVKYAVFIRRDVIMAAQPAITFIRNQYPAVEIERKFNEGDYVPSESPLMYIKGKFSNLVMLETLFLQKLGFTCVSAYNAYQISLAMKDVDFMDMHARHAAGEDMNHLATYGCSVGSKAAQNKGARGFIGGAQDITAHYFNKLHGMGTMPHALVGLAKTMYPNINSMVAAVDMYLNTMPDEQNIVALVDYDGKEITDALACAEYMYKNHDNKRLSIRLDTHGGRFAETLDYAKSVKVVSNHISDGKMTEYEIVRDVMGYNSFAMDEDDTIKDKVRKILFGTGVSAANVINMRNHLDAEGFNDVFIVASSGFDEIKCAIFNAVHAPVDMIGTGSFLPKKYSETYATADIIEYNGINSVKVGREFLYD